MWSNKKILNPYIDFTDLNKNHKITKEVAILANQSSSSLTESIKYAINNYEKLKFLGANSLKKVKLMYTWDKKVLDIINSFNEKSCGRISFIIPNISQPRFSKRISEYRNNNKITPFFLREKL